MRVIISKIKTKIACFCSKFGRRRGSFLLEIAIAMSIIGIFSGFLITKIVLANKVMREQVAKNNIAVVSVALASFVAKNNRLPRPALDDSGLETAQLGTCMGKVPYGTLEISVKNTVDGRGRSLIYIVEPQLTHDFDRIYDTTFLGRCFCEGIPDPKISVKQMSNSSHELIAFVLDTDENLPDISEKITVTAAKNTYWISRDMLLMQYLKNSPCRRENNDPSSSSQQSNTSGSGDSFDLF
ncbi:MAG: type II secretion system GspH family protein [Holosporaceae bacterium]|jgi:type II secretory pathway pseudopilin PulG|nr:type II secretion system GspH family protein [Holosporaceae bacterium]